MPKRKPSKKNKYNAVKTEYNGVKYDSKKEASRAFTLDVLRKAKGNDRVLNIERQVSYDLIVNNIKIARYVLDFKITYSDRVVHEDVKGVLTPVYKLKKKLMKAIHGIDIIDV